ncbi:MAG: hypothetical protein K2H87_04975 [Duncaniella sp.]|nr:hypothetical protein [Duncaniella sp.]
MKHFLKRCGTVLRILLLISPSACIVALPWPDSVPWWLIVLSMWGSLCAMAVLIVLATFVWATIASHVLHPETGDR